MKLRLMKRNYILVASIIIVVVFSVGILSLLFNESQASLTNNEITEKGTKLVLKNNNSQLWEHVNLAVSNATLKNGTAQSFYIEAWIKPGGTLTMDLSNMLGFENNPLPNGTNLRVLARGGLFNTKPGGNGDFHLSVQGWCNAPTSQNGYPWYTISQISMPIGQLPSNITRNTAIISTNPGDAEGSEPKNVEVLFTQMSMTVDSDGNLQIIFPIDPKLNQTETHIV